MLGPHVGRATVSNNAFRGRVASHGIVNIPTIFMGKGRFNRNHVALARVITGVSANTRGHTTRRLGGHSTCSMLVINSNPTNTTTTVCSTHGNVHANLVNRHFNNRVLSAISVRGCVSMPGARKRGLTNTLGIRISRCSISIVSDRDTDGLVPTTIRNNLRRVRATSNTMLGTHDVVITANTG